LAIQAPANPATKNYNMITPADDDFDDTVQSLDPDDISDRYLPARMINEAAYCPRLFYLMHVEGQFAHNAETVDGETVHRRVDQKTDALAAPATLTQLTLALDDPSHEKPDAQVEPWQISPPTTMPEVGKDEVAQEDRTLPSDEKIHARSVTLASDQLGVVAKLDLIEGTGTRVTPVDYKRGKPKRASDGSLTAWKPERVQICLQALVLRENGFECDEGVLYFNTTRQRVTIKIDQPLIDVTTKAVKRARIIAQQSVSPPPLVGSPKCPKCSLSAICLPDETNRCRARDGLGESPAVIRLPTTPRDDLRPLYLNTQGVYVGKSAEVLVVKEGGKVIQEVRLREINQVNLFGNIQLSTQAIQTLCELEIPLVFHSQHGYFNGMLQGTGLKNILLRREQFRMADQTARCLPIAKSLISGKIHNHRVMLMRNHVNPPASALVDLKRLIHRVERATASESLLGIEGTAARIYFQHFSGMLKPGSSPIDPALALGEPPQYVFDFRGRNRRPPRDPVNALLSLAYALLAKDLTVIAAAVGFDPYLGFFHLPRPGRPALALDLMEPFRPLIAESAVITAINNRMVYPEHFVAAGRGVTMTTSGRKALFRAYEQRMDQLVTHPLFDYRVSYRRLLEIQTRLLARVVSGELDTYPVFITR
jgi:CRISP-associated protein Cas1